MDHYRPEGPTRLWLVFLITLIFCGVELAGGYYANSWALIADSFHMGTDSLALFIGAGASTLARHSIHESIIKKGAALLNALLLLGVAAFWIAPEAYDRLNIPHNILSIPMLITAGIGLVINIVGIFLLRRQAHHDINSRSVLYHLFSDAAGSMGVIIAALIIWRWNWITADAWASFLVASLMVLYSLKLTKEILRDMRKT